MKLHTNDSPTYSSQTLVQQEFKISASAKAFKILSANLYSNRIRAIIRELSANAADAHTAAGTPDRAFLVHMPSQIDPILWIRDFGIGLSPEQVMTLYTTYFESTKADSNEYIGALGLGSKSPFAYVDSFTVTSFYNGTKTIYDMSLKGGVPNVAILFSGETDEENGLQISMSVNNNDINLFRREASYVYSTFKVKPEFAGQNVDCDLGDSYKDFGTYFTTLNRFHPAGVYAVMGNIVYPVDTLQTGCGDIVKILGGSSAIFIRFELGELDIAPSREELSYDSQTLRVMTDRMQNLETTVLGDTLDKYKDVTCERVAYQMSQREAYGLRKVVQDRVIIDHKSINQWNSSCQWSAFNSKQRVRIRYRRITLRDTLSHDTTWRGNRSWNSDNLADISREELKIFVNDDKKNPIQTLRALFASGVYKKNDQVWVFDTKDNPAAKEQCDELIDLWRGKAHVVFNSKEEDVRKEWVKANKAASPEDRVRSGPKSNCELLKRVDGSWTTERVQMYAEDIKEYEGYFIRKFFDTYTDAKENTLMNRITTLYSYLDMQEIKEVLIVRKGQWNLVEKSDSVIDVFQEMVDTVETISGRQVARKTITTSCTPSWISTLIPVLNSDQVKKIVPKRRFYTPHKAYNFFAKLIDDGLVISRLNEDALKQLRMYKGTKAAMDRAFTAKYVEAEAKHPMLCFAVNKASNMYEIEQFKSDIDVLLA